MNIRNSLIILFLSLSTLCRAQDSISISIENPQPRVEEKVVLSIDLQFLTKRIAEKLGSKITLTNINSIHGIESTDFDRIITFHEPGDYIVGPFLFNIDGKQYLSNAIKVQVIEKLPVQEGIWVRYIETGGERMIIVEQMINNKSDYKKTKKGYSMTMGGVKGDEEFAELMEESYKGYKIISSSSNSSTVREEGKDLFTPGFSYRFKSYGLELLPDYQGPIIISEKDFQNFPSKYKMTPIKIEKVIHN
ncbi:MAG TPA: hypothetical protein VD908_00165 [Cytophagales bacterium]|nr:hypothetical protein [Cytophagales bacterium]